MFDLDTIPASQASSNTIAAPQDTGAPSDSIAIERLPFIVHLVHSEVDLLKAVEIRHAAYSRHVPEFARALEAPESADAENGVVVLLASSKLDGSPLGTMRIQTNKHKSLTLEQSVDLPDWLNGKTLAEATRLGITEHRIGRVVRNVLFKAYFQFCQQNGIEWMVIAGRSPIDRIYERLMFKDVYPGLGYIPLLHANNMPHRVMSFNVGTAEVRWAAAKHPLFNFIFRTQHPDIILNPKSSVVEKHQAPSESDDIAVTSV